ncbi:diaminopimelate decarboxylase [Candidatus Peregrinibacteria bacterium]|nr:diaminopimelate decarboxylase [Candidatus Peregrinibacteria bacterium]
MNKQVIYYPEDAVLRAVKQFETPFFLYDEARLRENCRNFKKAFSRHFPNFWPLYAVKANSNPEILKIIAEEGFDFDASSPSEVWITRKLGKTEDFAMSSIGMFTGNYNPASELKYAKDAGYLLNLDDISMIPMLQEIGVSEFISLRINPGVGKATIESNVFAGPNAKYGIPFEQAAQAYAMVRDMGVKRFGIHMMTGSNVPIGEKNYFGDIIKKLLEVVADIKEKTGVEIELLNMGGGFGVPYRPEEDSLNMEEIALSVRKAFDEQCEKYGLKEPHLMAEPGRWITADMGFLVSRVDVIKDGYKKFVGIDASSNDMPRPSIYGAYHHVSVIQARESSGGKPETVSIAGKICENNDQLAQDRELLHCEVGDIIVIHNCGAHAYSMGHNYNGRLRHAEYLLRIDGSFAKIRRAETFEDLYATILS